MLKRMVKYTIMMLLMVGNVTLAGTYHYYIDVTTRFVGNEQQQLNSLQMTWLYDKDVSSMLFNSTAGSEEAKKNELNIIGERVLADLKGLNYFMVLKANQQKIALGEVANHTMDLVKGSQLRLSFTLPLETPIELKGKELSIELADKGGTAFLSYQNNGRLSFADNIQPKCAVKVTNIDVVEHGNPLQDVKIHCP